LEKQKEDHPQTTHLEMGSSNKSSSCISVLFFSYLLISVCFSQPAFSQLSSHRGLISCLPFVNQLFLALCLNIDASVSVDVLNGCFSGPVIGVIQAATSVTIVANVAASVILTNVIAICVRLTALIQVNPALANIISSKADSYSATLDSFSSAVGSVNDLAGSVLDVRTAPNFLAALAAAGCAAIPAIINLAIIIILSLLFNQVFMQCLYGLVPALAAVIAQVLVLVEGVLIALGALLGPILVTVVGLLGGVLTTVAVLLNGLLFPTLFQVCGIAFPHLVALLSHGLLDQLCQLPCHIIPPSAALAQAAPVYQALSYSC
jgi:hypothetical protein